MLLNPPKPLDMGGRVRNVTRPIYFDYRSFHSAGIYSPAFETCARAYSRLLASFDIKVTSGGIYSMHTRRKWPISERDMNVKQALRNAYRSIKKK